MEKKQDWRNEADYEYKKSIMGDAQYWAWQFIRRNSEYKKGWEKAVKNVLSLFPKIKDVYTPEMEITTILPRDEKCIQVWGTTHFINPENKTHNFMITNDYTPIFLNKNQVASSQELFRYGEKTIKIPSGKACVLFDLNKPIMHQYKQIEKLLRSLQKPEMKLIKKDMPVKLRTPKTYYHDKWPVYLRVFDARKVKVSYKEIAEIIFPDIENKYYDYLGNDRVKKAYKTALELINGGYKSILML